MNKVYGVVYSVSGIVMTGCVLYMVLGPTRCKLIALYGVKATENACQRQAENWANLADSARRVYDGSRNVSV